MKKAKLFSVFMCFILLLGIPAYAQSQPVTKLSSNGNKIIYQKKEIKDIKELLERAKKGINDIPLSKLPKAMINMKAVLKNSNGTEIPLDFYMTTQLLSKTETHQGVIENYALSIISPMSSGGTFYTDGWDSSGGVYAIVTGHYSTDSNGQVLLTEVTGGWTVYDAFESVSGFEVDYVCDGISVNGHISVNQSGTKYPTTNYSSYDYATGFTKYVSPDLYGYFVSVKSSCTVTRNGSHWTFALGPAYK